MEFNFFSFLWSWLVGPLQTHSGFLGHELTNIDFQTCWSPTLGCIFSREFSWSTKLLRVNFSCYTILKSELCCLYTTTYEHIAYSTMLYVGATIKFPYLSESSMLFYVSTTPFSSTCESSNFVKIPRIFQLTVLMFVDAYSLCFIFYLLFFTYIYVSFFFQLIWSFNVIHIFYLYICIRNCVFTCVVAKGGMRAVFRKI